MKHSIRRQMAVAFIGIIAGTFFLCYMANRLFLEDYYFQDKKKALIGAFEVLNQGVSDGQINDDAFTTKLQLICSTDNIALFVMDISGEPKLWTNRDYKTLQRKLYGYIFELETPGKQEILEKGENYVVRESVDYLTGAEYIEIIGTMDSGEPFIMWTAVESIRDSARISNQFFLQIALMGLIVSSLVIWWMSRRISEPILELADISRRMTELDFEAKYTPAGRKRNEIDELGAHMNEMSHTLEQVIADLKSANNRLLRDIEKKTQIDQMRREFLSNVSHELKTPIALIQGYAEGLIEGVSEDEESRSFYCGVIADEAEKMNLIVKKLLTLSQLESGGETVMMERFDVTELIAGLLHSAEILMEQNGITVTQYPQQPAYVWADEFMVEEAVGNYLSNAIHYAKGKKEIAVRYETHPGVLRVCVYNSGDPIPEDELGKIWNKFYKVDKARTREYGGSGIGLSIVKAVMEAFHRECGVINKKDGVEFWFELDTESRITE